MQPRWEEIELYQLEQRVGMQAFRAPTVFGFYDHDYSRAGLHVPELQLASAPKMVGLLNGLTSLVKYGLTSCGGGFGGWADPSSRDGLASRHGCYWIEACERETTLYQPNLRNAHRTTRCFT